MGIEANGVRLQKVIANAGVASRRAAETLMREGRVTVNGAVVSTLGARAHPETDDIRVDGRRVGRGGRRRYLLLNKPRGVVTTRDDPQRRRTVMDFLSGVSESVYPVGRLDYDSAGLLLLTNDGDLAARLTHPRHGLERVYEARVRGVPNASALKRLARGVVLDGRRTAPAIASLVQAGRGLHGNQAVLRICITEGRNRQVRQMCTAIGHPVMRLRRVRIGPIQDQGLRPGQVRDLTPGEVTALRHAVAHSKPAASSQQPGAERSTETNTPRDPVIAIDGPSGAGKGSVSRAVSPRRSVAAMSTRGPCIGPWPGWRPTRASRLTTSRPSRALAEHARAGTRRPDRAGRGTRRHPRHPHRGDRRGGGPCCADGLRPGGARASPAGLRLRRRPRHGGPRHRHDRLSRGRREDLPGRLVRTSVPNAAPWTDPAHGLGGVHAGAVRRGQCARSPRPL